MEVKEKRLQDTQVAFIRYRGPYDKIPELISEVVEWVMNKDLNMTGTIYGAYFNRPDDVPPEQLFYEIGASFEGNARDEGNVQVKIIPEHTVVATMHKGPYDQVGPVIEGLAKYAVENGYDIIGPVTEVYLNNPNEVEPEKLLTEVQFPVIKIG
ncbi:AraC family transcriptional regulator [Methanobacterium sp. ACI-7]|uniref:AraC family transcriptional regulator n=1 Tax=unclassified Methanobacterium TaxID=2627676 RepID=UPI0039C19157